MVYPSHFIFYNTLIRFISSFLICCFIIAAIRCVIVSSDISSPAYGLGSLSNDEAGMSGVVYTLAGESDWMVHIWLFQPNNGRAGLAVSWAR